MRVYRNTVLSGCVEALRANYPVVAQLLGEEMFEAVATDHATECPPRKPVLALYGARFPDWLEGQAWVRDLRYVPHVARIERLHVESLFAADVEPLQMADLAGRDDWQALQLSLHPATRFDWLTSPAMSIWLAHRSGFEKEIEFDWHAEGVLFTRPGLEVKPISLSRAGHRFLFGIRLGETVGAAAVATAQLYPETDIGSLFSSFVDCGAIAASTHRS
jgi:hypothetical protein